MNTNDQEQNHANLISRYWPPDDMLHPDRLLCADSLLRPGRLLCADGLLRPVELLHLGRLLRPDELLRCTAVKD